MATDSNIEWTDASWQVTTGCTHKSPGCAHCYAERMAKRLAGMAAADVAAGRNPGRKAAYSLAVLDNGHWSGVVSPVDDESLLAPLRWRRPRMIFVNSMSDLFWGDDEDLETARRRGVKDPRPIEFEFIDKVFAIAALCPQHTFQILTKRPERMAEYFDHLERAAADHAPHTKSGVFTPTNVLNIRWLNATKLGGPNSGYLAVGPAIGNDVGWPLPNVWLGVSAENQAAADARIPHLLRCPAAVRFVSCEPLIGPVNLRAATRVAWQCGKCKWFFPDPLKEICPACGVRGYWSGSHKFNPPGGQRGSGIDWVIAGGESGPGARQCRADWIRDIASECNVSGVPLFVKQLGSNPVDCSRMSIDRDRLRLNLKHPKGGDPAEWPESLRVREWPTTKAEAAK